MELKLEVKKLEERDTKNSCEYVGVCFETRIALCDGCL